MRQRAGELPTVVSRLVNPVSGSVTFWWDRIRRSEFATGGFPRFEAVWMVPAG